MQNAKAAPSTWMCGCTKDIPFKRPYLFVNALTEGVRKEVSESTMLADDILRFGGKEEDMAEYLDTYIKSLQERGMRVSNLAGRKLNLWISLLNRVNKDNESPC